jgi:hypothetical protein
MEPCFLQFYYEVPLHIAVFGLWSEEVTGYLRRKNGNGERSEKERTILPVRRMIAYQPSILSGLFRGIVPQ